jgi:hypothetical protein
MSKTKISEFSQTASQNTDINSININEGCPPSTINNAIRELMKQIKDFQVGAQGDGLTVSTLVATTATLGAVSYSETLTGGTGIVNIGSGQFYKDASGNVGIGTTTTWGKTTSFGNGYSNANVFTIAGINLTNNSDKGGLITGAPYTNANSPYVVLGCYNDNFGRYVYMGGGAWGFPDANDLLFYTAAAYNQNTDEGKLRLYITSNGSFQRCIPGSTTNNTYPDFCARAWVNFDGTGTVAIRASGNVSSITDLGTGQYQVNFTTAMPDANYSAVTESIYGWSSATFGADYIDIIGATSFSNTTSSFQIFASRITASTGVANELDPATVQVAVFR